MTDGWIDGWERIEADASGGSLVDGGNPKGLLHSTEGSTFDGALAAYRGPVKGWPNGTVSPVERRKGQHYPIGVTSRGLEHPAGTPETNRAVVFQIEIVGRAAELGDLAPADLAYLADAVREASDACGIPVVVTVDTTVGAPRMTPDAFAAYSGWLTHGVAPSQPGGHWDPGYLDVPAVIAAAQPAPPIPTPTPPTEEQDMLASYIIAVDLAYAAVGRAGDKGIAGWHKLLGERPADQRDAILADCISKLNGGP